jgi:threonine/homoserine/homoserine lactone efflux protein
MLDSQVLAFAAIAAASTLTPGVDTMLVVRNVLRGGCRDGVVTTWGICVGLCVHATLSALGVALIPMHSATAFHVVKFAGACCMGWLGVQSLYGSVRGTHQAAGPERLVTTGVVSPQRCFSEGFLSDVLNPTVVIFYLAFLPQFIGPTDAVLRKSLLLAGIHNAEGLLWFITMSLVVGQTRRFFLKSTVCRWLDGLCGTLFVGLGARLALEHQ